MALLFGPSVEHGANILLTNPAIGVGSRLTFRMHPGFKCIKSLQQRHTLQCILITSICWFH